MSQTKHFSAQEIPEYITQLKDFKKWRFMGNSFQAATLLGVLENYLLQNKLDQVQKLLQIRITNNQNGLNMKKILEEACKLKLGNQILDNIIDALKNKDQHNQFLSSFLTEYIKHKKGHEVSDGQLQQDFYQFFNLRLILIKKEQNLTTLDAKSKDCVFLYIEDSKYYVVCQNLSIQQPNCSYCNKQANEQAIKFKCSHTLICNSCLNNFFNKTHENIMCKEKQCQIFITWKDFQDLQNKIQQTSRIQQNEISQEKNEKCIMCKQNYEIDDLLCFTGCQHKLCQRCLRTTYARLPNTQEIKCLVFQCIGKVTNQEFYRFYNKGFQKTNSVIVEKQQTQDKRFYQSSSTPGFNSEQDQVSECIYCLKTYRLQFMYKPICNHNYCQSCCDKFSNQIQFKCCQRECQIQIKTQDIQDFYYKLIQKKVFSECANCNTQVRISEALTNDCDHQICFECINKIYESKACKCQKCYSKINTRLIDEYFLQRTMENSKIQQEKIDIEFQTHCTFCFSPFTDYNLQQNLTCPSHLVGTCCIIMPLDCPQCYLPSLQIEKQKLQFQLQTFLVESLEYYPETPIKQQKESSILD